MSRLDSLPQRIFYLPESHYFHAVAQLRVVAPAAALEVPLIDLRDPENDRELDRVSARDASRDLLIIHRMVNGYYARARKLIEFASAKGIPIVYETDDLLLNVPACHPDKAHLDERLLSTLEATLCADGVTVSTEYLREKLSVFHQRSHVAPNRLPAPIWNTMEAAYQRRAQNPGERGAARIGYLGTATHRPDFAAIAPALREVLRAYPRVELIAFGVPLPAELADLPNARFQQPTRHARQSYSEYAREAAELNLDIGIAPLIDSEFNRCKSLIKHLEYGALGLVGVYSDVDPYHSGVRHGETGFLAASLADWQAILTTLIESPDERVRVRDNLHGEISEHWTLANPEGVAPWRDAWLAAREDAATAAYSLEAQRRRDLLDIVRREIDRQAGSRGEFPPRRRFRGLRRQFVKAQRWWNETLAAAQRFRHGRRSA